MVGNPIPAGPPRLVWFVRCGKCQTEGPVCHSKEEAIDAWDLRVLPAWSSEMPTEEGWYLVTHSVRRRPCLVEVRPEMIRGKLELRMWADNWRTSGDLWCDSSWLKIDVPAEP